MLKIAICEDEKRYMEELEKCLRVWAVNAAANIKIRKYSGGEPLLSDIHAGEAFDLIFMDIEMEGMSGLETAACIRERDYTTSLIFVSQHENYYKEAYHAYPFCFLNKPIDFKEFETTMDAYMKMSKQDIETFTFSIKKAQYHLRLNDIIYFCSERRHVIAVCKEQRYSFYGKLSEVQKELENRTDRFLRIHQSYLVNTKYVKEYRYSSVILHNGESLYISKEKRKAMREIHMLLMED